MKHLTVTYDGLNLFDADVEELVLTDNTDGVTVQGRLTRKAAAGTGLLDLLASATKPKPKEDTTDG